MSTLGKVLRKLDERLKYLDKRQVYTGIYQHTQITCRRHNKYYSVIHFGRVRYRFRYNISIYPLYTRTYLDYDDLFIHNDSRHEFPHIDSQVWYDELTKIYQWFNLHDYDLTNINLLNDTQNKVILINRSDEIRKLCGLICKKNVCLKHTYQTIQFTTYMCVFEISRTIQVSTELAIANGYQMAVPHNIKWVSLFSTTSRKKSQWKFDFCMHILDKIEALLYAAMITMTILPTNNI